MVSKKLILGIVSVLILWTNPGFSEPTITSITGNVTHGGNISISGNLFGTKSPASPLVWDDMEGQKVDDYTVLTDDLGFNTPTGGYRDPWPKLGSGGEIVQTQYRSVPFRNTLAPHPFSGTYMAGCHYQTPNNNPPYIGGRETYRSVGLTADSGSTSGTWYIRFYYRLDPLWNTSNLGYNNHKMSVPEQGSTQYSSSPFSYLDYCNSQTPAYMGEGETTKWHGNASCEIAPSAENPLFTWISFEETWNNPENTRKARVNNKIISQNTTNLGATVRAWSIGTYYRRASNINDTSTYRGGVLDSNYRYFDDIYIDNTLSRVILANNANYESATIVEPQIPSSWTNNSITATVNFGAITDNQAYIFVFDANNNHNHAGYPVTIGGGGGAVPNPPTGLAVLENCTNGVDDNENGLIDCADSDCGSDPSCN